MFEPETSTMEGHPLFKEIKYILKYMLKIKHEHVHTCICIIHIHVLHMFVHVHVKVFQNKSTI